MRRCDLLVRNHGAADAGDRWCPRFPNVTMAAAEWPFWLVATMSWGARTRLTSQPLPFLRQAATAAIGAPYATPPLRRPRKTQPAPAAGEQLAGAESASDSTAGAVAGVTPAAAATFGAAPPPPRPSGPPHCCSTCAAKRC